jgi:hypothetical protein
MSEHEEKQVTRRAEGVPFASTPCAQVCSALAAAQAKFKAPKRSKPVTVRTKTGETYSFVYAPLEAVFDAVREGLSAAELSVYQHLVRSDGFYVRSYVVHSSGEWLGGQDYPVFSKEGAQGFASGVTYARRNSLLLTLGLAAEDADDDGNEAAGNTVVDIKPSKAPPGAVVAPSPIAGAANAAVDPVVGGPGQPAPGEQFDSETGEIIIDHEAEEAMLWRANELLAQAAEHGTKVLETQWLALPKRKGLQLKLKEKLEKRYKLRALEVDAQAK